MSTKRTWKSFLGQLFALAILFGLFFLLLYPGCQAYMDGRNQMLRSTNFRNIAIAIHRAHEKRVPLSQAICRPNGAPLLSWRVAILPYLEDASATALYKQFKLDEPWDSKHNYALIGKMPEVYKSAGLDLPANHTLMKVFVASPGYKKGKYRPVWPATGTPEFNFIFASLTDPPSSTILVAEVGSPVPWTKPEDIVIDETIEDDKTPLDFLFHRVGHNVLGFHAAMADGSVRTFYVKPGNPKKLLRPIIGYQDGEIVTDDVFD